MPYKLIEKTCVRIIIKGEEDKKVRKLGTGVIITFEGRYYVLTACHCLGNPLPELKEIKIEKQKDYQSDFEKINILSIHLHDFDDDWALIEIEFEDTDKVINSCKIGKNFIMNEEIIFCGYQNISNNQFRPFDAKIILLADYKFQIKLLDDTFHQAGEDGKFLAEGLSGSGVYIIKDRTPYLIGILNSVKTDKAWNDDIKCSSLNCISNLINQLEDLSDINNLKTWAENLQIEKTKVDIDKFKSINNEFFDNLDRKNKVIYDTEEEANKNTQKQLLKYLSLKENINQLENMSPRLYKDFQNIVKNFQDSVEDEYSRSVNDNNEAKDKKLDLKNDLKLELEKILPKELKFDVADYQITEWLLDCSLNFTNR